MASRGCEEWAGRGNRSAASAEQWPGCQSGAGDQGHRSVEMNRPGISDLAFIEDPEANAVIWVARPESAKGVLRWWEASHALRRLRACHPDACCSRGSPNRR